MERKYTIYQTDILDTLEDVLQYLIESECRNYEETYDYDTTDIPDDKIIEDAQKESAQDHIYIKALVLKQYYEL